MFFSHTEHILVSKDVSARDKTTFKEWFLCKFSRTVSGPWLLTIGLVIATPVFHCEGVCVCSSVFSCYAWLLQVVRCDFLEQKGALLVLRFALHLFLLSLDVVALLCTRFQFRAMFVSCEDLSWV